MPQVLLYLTGIIIVFWVTLIGALWMDERATAKGAAAFSKASGWVAVFATVAMAGTGAVLLELS